MFITKQMSTDKVIRAKIDAVRKTFCCHGQYLSEDGKDYRLEYKPKGSRVRLEKAGFVVDEIDGKLYARVPLGTHMADGVAIDSETHQPVCSLCEPKANLTV